MTQQRVNVGSLPGDGTGDSGQVPFNKVNNNDNELYQFAVYYGTDSGLANAYVVAIVGPIPIAFLLDPGTMVLFTPVNANTGSSSLNVQGSGVVALLNIQGKPLSGGELSPGIPAFAQYNGSAWQLIVPNTAALLAPISGLSQTAAEIAANVTVVNPDFPVLSVDRYLTNTTPGTTPMAQGFNFAVKVAYFAGGGVVTYGLTSPYNLEAPINCTFGGSANFGGICIRNVGQISNDAGFGLIATHNGAAVFDFTGSDMPVLDNVSIRSPNTVGFPVCGIYMARNSHKNSSYMRMNNVRIEGNFGAGGCVYNYGCEDDVYVGCYFYNQTALANTGTFYVTANNIQMLNPAFGTDPLGVTVSQYPNTGVSCTDHNFFGCQFFNGGGFNNSDCIRLDACDSVRIYGGWGFSLNTITNVQGRALIYVYTTNGATNNVTIDGFIGESASPTQAFGIFVDNQTSAVLSGWHIKNFRAYNTSFAIGSNTGPVMDNWRISSMPTYSTGNGINWLGTVQNCVLDVGAIGMACNAMMNTSYTGDTSRLTVNGLGYGNIGGAGGISITETGATNRSFSNIIPKTTGGTWTISGSMTEHDNLAYDSNMAHFSIVFGATNVAYTAGTTLTLPFTSVQVATCQVTDTVTGLSLGIGIISGNTLTLPVAVTTNAHTISIQGFAYVS